MALSDDAINQCIEQIVTHCRLPIDRDLMTPFIEKLRPKFVSRLDGPRGADTWAKDRPHMEDNSRYLGVLTEMFAKQDGEVRTEHLQSALETVSAYCTVGKGAAFTLIVYCDGFRGANKAAAALFAAARGLKKTTTQAAKPKKAAKKTKTAKKKKK